MIDLHKWCCKETKRFDIGEPFVIDGYTYATDKAALIRVPTDQPNTIDRILPRGVAQIFKPRGDEWWESDLAPVQCEKCGGVGIIHRDAIPCVQCNDTGVVEHECDCSHCDIEEEDCPSCYGKARKASDDPCGCYATICGLKIATRYVNLLRELPSVKVQSSGEVLRVQFDGGEAAVYSLTH